MILIVEDRIKHIILIMTQFSVNDVRITTRSKDSDVGESLFSAIHEVGHAFYELGIN